MAQKEGISSGDFVLWFLAAFMALGLFLLAPKLGHSVTLIMVFAMFACLIHPISQLSIVKKAQSPKKKITRLMSLLTLAAGAIAAFGLYVWPESKRAVIITRVVVSPYQMGKPVSVNVHVINRDSPGVEFNGFWQMRVWRDVIVPGGDPREQRNIEDDNWSEFIKTTETRSSKEHLNLTLPVGVEKALLEQVDFTDDDTRALISGKESLYIVGLIRDADGGYVTPYCVIKTPHMAEMTYCQGHN